MKRCGLLLVFLAIGFFGALIGAVWMLTAIIFAPNGSRADHIAIAFDQLGNATTGGNEDETISSRAGRLSMESLPIIYTVGGGKRGSKTAELVIRNW